MMPIRSAFVMEQTLGHVTHAQNLRAVADGRSDLQATWFPVPFDVHGPGRFVPLLRGNWSVRASWRARRSLNAALATQAHDAVVFHTQVTALFSLGIMRRLPAIVSLDATPINFDSVGQFYNHQPAGPGLLDRQKYRLNRRVFHAAAGLVTWSEWARQSLVDDYDVDPGRVRVIAPGASSAYFDVGERRLARDAHPSGNARRVRVLFVGGDFRRKGGPLLLDALRGPLADRCEVHLVTQDVVLPSRNVYVHRGLGPNSPELLRLFEDADLFVLPSMAECLAVVLMEATAAGLPIVTTGVGALREAVHDGNSGMIVRAGDASALRRALERIVDDAELRRRMGHAGRVLAVEKFDARRNGRALLDMVVELAETARRSGRAA